MHQHEHPVASSIEAHYRARTPRSAEQHRIAQYYLPGGDSRTITFFQPHPLYVQSAHGASMLDVDGNKYLDFLGNYTSIIHGHGHPALTEAIAKQAALGTAYAACTPAQVELAQELCRRVPSIERIRFCNSGTEATMNALRAARAFTGRVKILKMEGGYHGSHDLVEVSVNPTMEAAAPADQLHPEPDEPGITDGVLQDIVVAFFNDPVSLTAAFERHGRELAAVIVEPMLGATGTIPAEPGFLQLVRSLSDQYGALVILDEVITFRLHEGGAQAIYDVKPDLTTLGKIIGGGLPVGAFGGRADIMALFAPPGNRMVQSGTFNANPITMVAGIAAMRMLPQEEINRINFLGVRLAIGLRSALRELRIAAQVTGEGSLQSVHFTPSPVKDYRSKAMAHGETQRLLHLSLLNKGIFLAPRGMFAISTPMSEEDVDNCIHAFAESLYEIRPFIADVAPHLCA